MLTSTPATSRARPRPSTEDRVMVENVIRPESRRRVDGPKYRAVRGEPDGGSRPSSWISKQKRLFVCEKTSPVRVHRG